MIKFTASLKPQGTLYGFGLSEANLNRLEFNSEPIFFDFGYCDRPDLFGLILYLEVFKTPEDIANNLETVQLHCLPFINPDRGVTTETLRVFPIARNIMAKFRRSPYWGFETSVEITNPHDKQMFFAGTTEQNIEQYLQNGGFLSVKTKRTFKGFGKK